MKQAVRAEIAQQAAFFNIDKGRSRGEGKWLAAII